MNKSTCLLVALLLAGCGRQEPVAPPAPKKAPAIQAARPAPQPSLKATPPAITNLAEASPPSQSFGSAAVDVITQRNKIEAGRKAKATIEAAASSENKDIEAVLNE